MAKLPFALQLYSVRDQLQVNPAATLARVKEIGYSHVELAGTADMSVESFKSLLDAHALLPVSAHVAFDRCHNDLGGAVAECKTLGVSWAVIPSLSEETGRTAADWVACAKSMDAFGRVFREAGIQLCFHNHTIEFEPVDGKTAFELIFENTAPENLAVELDAGWAHYAGADPVQLLKRYAQRTPLVHIKDVKARVEGEAPVPTELGNGATHLGPIIKTAGETGVSWLIVEQDSAARDTLESARMNAAYMRVHVF